MAQFALQRRRDGFACQFRHALHGRLGDGIRVILEFPFGCSLNGEALRNGSKDDLNGHIKASETEDQENVFGDNMGLLGVV